MRFVVPKHPLVAGGADDAVQQRADRVDVELPGVHVVEHVLVRHEHVRAIELVVRDGLVVVGVPPHHAVVHVKRDRRGLQRRRPHLDLIQLSLVVHTVAPPEAPKEQALGVGGAVEDLHGVHRVGVVAILRHVHASGHSVDEELEFGRLLRPVGFEAHGDHDSDVLPLAHDQSAGGGVGLGAVVRAVVAVGPERECALHMVGAAPRAVVTHDRNRPAVVLDRRDELRAADVGRLNPRLERERILWRHGLCEVDGDLRVVAIEVK
mmetsp:Transcript_36808/g.90877  ORF Transcript_36808/g.90877 Transcript_36808/m.90877 type:complete len:264 (+) Transcript_36808:572-1363(+)